MLPSWNMGNDMCDLLSDLLAPIGAQLLGARAHNGVRWGDVGLGTSATKTRNDQHSPLFN